MLGPPPRRPETDTTSLSQLTSFRRLLTIRPVPIENFSRNKNSVNMLNKINKMQKLSADNSLLGERLRRLKKLRPPHGYGSCHDGIKWTGRWGLWYEVQFMLVNCQP